VIPELGHFALILALALALCQGIIPMIGAHRNDSAMMAVARSAATGQFLLVAFSFACLTWAFLHDDFSVAYVANHSQLQLPDFYKISAVWSAHEGSLLLWVLILSTWTVAVAGLSRNLPDAFASRVIAVLGLLSTGFLLFTIMTSSPFARLSPAAIDGADLNPLLQDPGLAIHPPILYFGYVGFSVAFAFAVAAMISGDLDQKWARWTRPWTTVAWMFLTVGIALGSWWAYYELGWGGWWFWDPVENASFMPWLVGTALIHSLAVTEKRGLFKSSTLLLAIGAFSLSLLGPFLVRSGVLVSVHAFATDPTRGVFILALIAVIVGGALALYAWRAPELNREVGFKPFSRETFILINNVLLSMAAGLILLGTLYPLIVEALDAGKISVGKPYFESVFIIPMIPLVLMAGIGMHTAWRSTDAKTLFRRLRGLAVIALLGGIAVPIVFYGTNTVLTAVGMVAGLWLIFSSCRDPVARLFGKGPRLTQAMIGMQLAHLGVGLFVLGVTTTSSFSIETDQRIVPGESVTVADYTIEFGTPRQVAGPNYTAMRSEMKISRDGKPVTVLYPEKRMYRVQKSPMTEADIDSGWRHDLFIALGEDLGQNAWSVRIQYKPLIRFIWFGTLVMALGGLVAVTDRRYRSVKHSKASATALDGVSAT